MKDRDPERKVLRFTRKIAGDEKGKAEHQDEQIVAEQIQALAELDLSVHTERVQTVLDATSKAECAYVNQEARKLVEERGIKYLAAELMKLGTSSNILKNPVYPRSIAKAFLLKVRLITEAQEKPFQ